MAEYALRLREKVGPQMLLQLPSVSVAVRDEEERVLLVRHIEGGEWLLPGGAVEPAELPADAALRETWEETGLRVRLTGLVGVFGGRDFVVQYRSGERASYVMIVFEARTEGGELSMNSDEILEARYVSPEAARSLELASWMPAVLQAGFDPDAAGRSFQLPSWKPSQ